VAQFGALIRRYRKAARMTQADVALATNCAERFIGELEAGKPTAHIGKAFLVAQAVGLPIQVWLGSAEPAPRPGPSSPDRQLPGFEDELPPLSEPVEDETIG
jgi:transcriptional regulator with XRE-family HTH domain